MFFLATVGTSSTSLAAMKLCPSSFRVVWPRRGNCWGHVSPGKGHARLVGSTELPLCAWCLQGKAHCLSTLGELPRLAELAAALSSAGWQARVSVRDPGKPGWLLLQD